jgi:uncharacterized delta-60 repeat protein
MSNPRSESPRSQRKLARSLPLFSFLPFLALAWTVGCGDDGDDDTQPQAGKGGSAGSSSAGKSGGGSSGKAGGAGKGGSSGSAGKGSGGSGAEGGSDGEGGSDAEGGSGAEGGDDGGTAGDAGGDQGGNGGTAGSAGSGGTSGGGSGGGDTGGSAGTSGGGSGGSDAGGSAGSSGGTAGSGGSSGDTFQAITKASDFVVTGATDLRGLVFARSGKIYASGHFGDDGTNATTGTDREIAIVRFNANGSLDTDFGTQGVVRHNLVTRVVDSSGASPVVVNSGNEESLGIVELADDNLLLQLNLRDAAGTGVDVALLKIEPDGDRVTTFGTNGVKRVDFGWVDEAEHANWPTAGTTPADQAWGLKLDTSEVGTEKVVVFGFGPAKYPSLTTGTSPVQRTDNDRFITRLLTSDGSRDPDFNGTGAPFTLNSGGTFGDNGRRGLVLPDGTIYAAGYTNFGAGLENHVMVIKLTPAGVPDPNFRYGIALPGVSRSNGFLNDGGAAECYSVGLLSDGHVITTGYGRATAAGLLSSLGWETTASVDLVSFGLLASGAPDFDWGSSSTLAIQSELLGRADTEERGRDLIVLPDDRVVHAGRFGGNPALFVVKPNGELDESSGVDGRFEYDPFTAPTSHFFAIAKSPDSRSIVATTNQHAEGVRVAFLTVAAE